MYNQFNDQLASSTRQYAETAAQINRLALQNVERVFGLQLQAMQSNAQAAFGYFTQLLDVRDVNGLREAVPAGVQVARESIERSVAAGQEAYASTLKANESIGQIAKGCDVAAQDRDIDVAVRTRRAAGEKVDGVPAGNPPRDAERREDGARLVR